MGGVNRHGGRIDFGAERQIGQAMKLLETSSMALPAQCPHCARVRRAGPVLEADPQSRAGHKAQRGDCVTSVSRTAGPGWSGVDLQRHRTLALQTLTQPSPTPFPLSFYQSLTTHYSLSLSLSLSCRHHCLYLYISLFIHMQSLKAERYSNSRNA